METNNVSVCFTMAHIGSLLMNRGKPQPPKLNHAARRKLKREGALFNTPVKVPRYRRW